MKILLIDGDQQLTQSIVDELTASGFNVDACSNGKDGLYTAITESYDLIILDRSLPQVDGLTIIKAIRAIRSATKILILSAQCSLQDKVEGLQLGADDYLTKPFSFIELKARLSALIRRHSPVDQFDPTELQLGDIRLDLKRRKTWLGNEQIRLQNRDFLLLEYLMRHAGQLVTRSMLLKNVWEYRFEPQTNIVDVHISRLRRKLNHNGPKHYITTVRGRGYVFELESTQSDDVVENA